MIHMHLKCNTKLKNENFRMKISSVVDSAYIIMKQPFKVLGMSLKIKNIMSLYALSVIDRFDKILTPYFINGHFVSRMKFFSTPWD